MNNYRLSMTENIDVVMIEAYDMKLYIEYGFTKGRFYINERLNGDGAQHRSPMGVKLMEVKSQGFINEAKAILSTLFGKTVEMAVSDMLDMAKEREEFTGRKYSAIIADTEENNKVMIDYLNHIIDTIE